MGPSWALAVAAAAVVTLVGTPLLRRVALATDFVDRPAAAHKSHKNATPYLGGVGIIVAVLVGLLFSARVTSNVAVVALGGPLIGMVGLLDDHRSIGPLPRFLVELLVAGVALAAGLHVQAFGVPLLDDALTVVWIVGVTNAINLLDNMDGLAAGVAATASLAIVALAILGEQTSVAALAAATFGACVGFLAYNRRPASIFMGDTGSLFLGFVLAVATIAVSPTVSPPTSFVVPLVLLALPVLDTTTVTLARMRHGRQVSIGGKDHLSHRLVKRGLSPGGAVWVLIGVEAAVGVLAVLAGRGVLTLPIAGAAAILILGSLAAVTARARVYIEPIIGFSTRLKLAVGAASGAVLILCAPAAVALIRAQHGGQEGTRAARAGLEALSAGDAARASALFSDAAEAFERAHDALDGPLASLALVVPGARSNLAASRAVVAVGRDVSQATARLSALADAPSLAVGRGNDPAAALARLAPALAESVTLLRSSAARLERADRPYLWPSLRRNVHELRSSLRREADRATRVSEIADVVPALLGSDGTRRYFLAVQDSSELRGSGGVVHYWGEVVAERGQLNITRLGPIEELVAAAPSTQPESVAASDYLQTYHAFNAAQTWQNVNVSPNFAVAGSLIADLYPKAGGKPVDGVIAVDVPGLAALLELTGPVSVSGLVEPVTSETVERVLTRDVHERFPVTPERDAVVSHVVRTTLEAFNAADLGTVSSLSNVLGKSARNGHLLVYASRAQEERVVQMVGLAGDMPRGPGDSLILVNQNLSGVAIDQFLQRKVSYNVELDPGNGDAGLAGRLEVTLANEAPTRGLPEDVIGPYDERFNAGENTTFVTVYTPWSLASITPAGNEKVDTTTEPGWQAHSTSVTIPSREFRTVAFDLQGTVNLAPGQWYHLALPLKPKPVPDQIEVTVSVPKGWRIAEVVGMRTDGPRRAVAQLTLTDPQTIAVRLERTTWAGIWHSLTK